MPPKQAKQTQHPKPPAPVSTSSPRGTRSSDGTRSDKPSTGSSAASHCSSSSLSNATLEPVAPLEHSENRRVLEVLGGGPTSASDPPATAPDNTLIVERKVTALLNKLTMEKFDKLSDQILAWANKSEEEKDRATLILVIKLIFEKAVDDAAWSEMYARLCRKMMEQISPDVKDNSVKNFMGQPIVGGQLFRKYLLNRCQEDFQRGWAVKETAADDAAQKAACEGSDESVLYSDEYYAPEKARQHRLGLVKFIGELFKLQMLTERIIHECIKWLLSNIENPEVVDIESLCLLLVTVGQAMDNERARDHMNVYFSRMAVLVENNNISSRIRFMVQVSSLRPVLLVNRQGLRIQ
jgi:translation initiation factor 4G